MEAALGEACTAPDERFAKVTAEASLFISGVSTRRQMKVAAVYKPAQVLHTGLNI